jgi:hypothetical protein
MPHDNVNAARYAAVRSLAATGDHVAAFALTVLPTYRHTDITTVVWCRSLGWGLAETLKVLRVNDYPAS